MEDGRGEGPVSRVADRMTALQALTGIGVWEWHPVTGRLVGDAHLAEILGMPADSLAGFGVDRWLALIHAEDRPACEVATRRVETGQAPGFDAVYRMRRGDDRWIWVHDRSRPSADDDGWLVGVLEDITEREEARRRWEKLARSVPGVIYTFELDAAGRPHFPYISDKVHDFYGVTPEAVRRDASIAFSAIHRDDLEGVQALLRASAERLSDWHCEYRAYSGGQWRWVEGRAVPERTADGGTRWHGLITSIQERKRLEEELRRLSVTDELTGLYNRRHLLACLEREYARFQRSGTPFSLVVIDLDDFKQVNDTRGHMAGDGVLQGMAAVFNDRLRDTDVAGRTGGEEFLLLLPDTDAEGAVRLAEDVRRALSALVFHDDRGHAFRVTLSAGVACVEATDEALHRLWARADRALYRAKRVGRDRVCPA